ncbi:MAG: integrase core domain-containing protein [Deltaproteobacteria bacterium]|nr:integrase core domain-containing protein [Deltaproteobacteria bacterium]
MATDPPLCLPTASISSIKIMYKNNAGSLCPCLIKQIPYTGGTNPHKHLDEIRTAYIKKRDISLCCYRSCKKGLRNYFWFYNNERPHQSLGDKTPAFTTCFVT